MSGTLGIAPIRTAGIDGVHRVVRALAVRRGALRRRGGLSTSWGVPVAVLLTVAVVWVTVSLANSLAAA
ncbi:MAG TPA: hypothetical protein VMX11_02995 [Actinomycetes bacterium]|nr:hypothetical protein [Actinomycetes bacterium]